MIAVAAVPVVEPAAVVDVPAAELAVLAAEPGVEPADGPAAVEPVAGPVVELVAAPVVGLPAVGGPEFVGLADDCVLDVDSGVIGNPCGLAHVSLDE